MKVQVPVALILMMTADGALAMAQDAATLYTYRSILLGTHERDLRPVAEVLTTAQGDVHSSLFDLAAELLHLESQSNHTNAERQKWLIRIVASSANGKYRKFLSSVGERTNSNQVASEIARGLENLRTSEDSIFVPGSIDLAALRQSLHDEKQAHPVRDVKVKTGRLRRTPTLREIYEIMGYPDHVRMTYPFGARVNGNETLSVIWENRYRADFEKRYAPSLRSEGRGRFIDMRFAALHTVPSFDLESVRERLLSGSPKHVRALLKDLRRTQTPPQPVLEALNEYVVEHLFAMDRGTLGNLREIADEFGRSGDSSYVESILMIRHGAAPTITRHATAALFRLYAETGDLAALHRELDGEDSEDVRLAAKAIHAANLYDKRTLDRLLEQVRSKHDANDPILLDALGIMCRAIGRSGDPDYREALVELSRAASAESIRLRAADAVAVMDRDRRAIIGGDQIEQYSTMPETRRTP